MDLSELYKVLEPDNYFETRDQRTSLLTYGQLCKDVHDMLGHQLSNLELIQRTPYMLGGLLKKGTRLSVKSLKRSLTGYINRMSASGEFNHVSDDLAHLILGFQRCQDNGKLIIQGDFHFRRLKISVNSFDFQPSKIENGFLMFLQFPRT